MIHLGRLWPYLQKFHLAGKACQGQTLQLIMEIRKITDEIIFMIQTPGVCSVKYYGFVIDRFFNKLACFKK
jgi:hypothetical protein